MISYETFLNQYTKKRKDDSVRILCDYKNKFGDMPFEEAYASEVDRINKSSEMYKKIRSFEDFLIKMKVRCERSKISESRYYHYNGKKYRFSSHIYPTGSMTDDILGIVDFAADPFFIENVKFQY